MADKTKFFIIAGEASGDLLGSKLIDELKKFSKKNNKNFEFVGIGGVLMQKAGLTSIFPMEDLSVMGFAEVLPHIPKLLRRINQTVESIINQNPTYLITIDSPDFCFRVVTKLKSRTYKNNYLNDFFNKIKKTHLIAPSVWAYRERRAQKIAKLYNLLLVILPFEPPYFEKYGLKTVFIGNPVVEESPDFDKKEQYNKLFRDKYQIAKSDILIYVTPGSRVGEVKRIFVEFIKSLNLLTKNHKNIKVVIPLVSKTKNLVTIMAKNLECDYYLINNEEKELALFSADFALAKSGTNTIEIALYQIPMIIAYRVSFFTYILAKILLRIKFANLVNLIANKEIIPEMIQQNCQSQKIYNKLGNLVNNKNIAKKQIQDSQTSLNILGLNAKTSSTNKAINEILAL